jgi:hypothetical protein
MALGARLLTAVKVQSRKRRPHARRCLAVGRRIPPRADGGCGRRICSGDTGRGRGRAQGLGSWLITAANVAGRAARRHAACFHATERMRVARSCGVCDRGRRGGAPGARLRRMSPRPPTLRRRSAWQPFPGRAPSHNDARSVHRPLRRLAPLLPIHPWAAYRPATLVPMRVTAGSE